MELERKNKLIHDFNERQVSNERRTAIETEVIKAEEKRKKLAKEAAAREKWLNQTKIFYYKLCFIYLTYTTIPITKKMHSIS